MRVVPQAFVTAALGKLPEPVRRRVGSPAVRRLLRFAPAALLALAASQLTYLLCAGVWHTTGRVSGAAGWLAGATVSYGVSRWAWERRGRPRLLQETVPFLAVSLVVGTVLTESSHIGYQLAAGFRLHGIEFGAFVQGFYLAANAVTFLLRFLIFHFILFNDRRASLAALVARVRPLLPELGRFTLVGIFGFLVADTVIRVLHGLAGLASLPSQAAALVVAAAVSFTGNRYWTFRNRERTTVGREGIRYFLLHTAGLLIQVACVGFTTDLLHLHSRAPVDTALALGIGLGISFRYWSCRTWVWRARAVPAPGV